MAAAATSSPSSPARLRGNLLLGNLLDFRRDRIGFSHRVARRGDLVETRMGLWPLTMASSPALAHEILVEKNDAFVKSAGLAVFARPLLGDGLLTSEHDEHKRQRRMMAPLFAHKRIAGYADVMAERGEKWAESLARAGRVDVADAMMRLTLEIVGKTLFDAELGGDADDVGDALTGAMREMMNAMIRLVPLPPVVPTRGNLRFRQAVRRLDDIVYRLIRQRRASTVDGSAAGGTSQTRGVDGSAAGGTSQTRGVDGSAAGGTSQMRGVDRGDLLGMLLLARHEDDGSALSDREIRDQSMTLMLAGHETTANALAWTIYLLGRNPDARARVEREIDAALGGRTPTAADLPNLPLALQALKEAMRLYPPAYTIGREATRPVTVGGSRIPKGRVVLVNIAGIHRRPDLFPDPERFDLDRLSVDNEKKLPPMAYMPFGGGPRVCIGNHFATMEGHILLVTLMQRVRIELVSRREAETEPLVTLRPKGGIQARIVPRIARQSSSTP